MAVTYVNQAPDASPRPPHPTPERVVLPPIQTITAENIAKAKRSVAERTSLAAAYVNGNLLIVQPTGALAAEIFGVSQAGVSRELASCGLKPVTPADLLTFLWINSPIERQEGFARKHGVAIWRIIDRLTQ